MKYFYDDVIAAMHMAKHYDMKYHWYNGYEKEWIYGGKDSIDDPWDFWSVGHDDVIRPTHGEKYIIHPNSYKILEIKDGDLLDGSNAGGRITHINDKSVHHCRCDYFVYNCKKMGGLVKGLPIIQRNGKPFFWPESE